jgi:serine/threonine-protein kinase
MAESFAIGTRFAKYEIVRLIGEGGMGAVYEAIHVELGKRVAIKTLLPAAAGKNEVRARFLREGQTASRIRHPNVVDVTDVGEQDGSPYLVMELLSGEDLSHMLERTGPLALDELLAIMLPVLAGVAAGHDAKIIHRDIKPQNIFLARGPRGAITPKVLDFGISKIATGASAGLTKTGALLGTIAYLSPEQARGAKYVDERTDQYAVGLVLYEAVTGRRAYDGENPLAIINDIAAGRFELPHRYRSDLPPGFEQVLLRALAVSENDRFPNLYAFGKELLPFASAKTRALTGDTFDHDAASEDSPADAASVAPVPAASGGQPSHPHGGSSQPPSHPHGGSSQPQTWLLPPAQTSASASVTSHQAPAATTLRSVASAVQEPARAAGARRSDRVWQALGLGGIAIGGVAVLLLVTRSSAPPPRPRPEAEEIVDPAPAPARRAAPAQLPPPAPAQLPPPAPAVVAVPAAPDAGAPLVPVAATAPEPAPARADAVKTRAAAAHVSAHGRSRGEGRGEGPSRRGSTTADDAPTFR